MASRRRRSSAGPGERAALASTGRQSSPLWGMGGPSEPGPKRVTATGEPCRGPRPRHPRPGLTEFHARRWRGLRQQIRDTERCRGRGEGGDRGGGFRRLDDGISPVAQSGFRSGGLAMDLEKAIDQVDDPVVLDPGSGVGSGLPPTGHGPAPLSRLPDQQEAIEELDGVVFVETAVVDQLLVLVPGPAALAGRVSACWRSRRRGCPEGCDRRRRWPSPGRESAGAGSSRSTSRPAPCRGRTRRRRG